MESTFVAENSEYSISYVKTKELTNYKLIKYLVKDKPSDETANLSIYVDTDSHTVLWSICDHFTTDEASEEVEYPRNYSLSDLKNSFEEYLVTAVKEGAKLIHVLNEYFQTTV